MAFVAQKPNSTPAVLKPFIALTGVFSALLNTQPVPHWSDYLNDRDN